MSTFHSMDSLFVQTKILWYLHIISIPTVRAFFYTLEMIATGLSASSKASFCISFISGGTTKQYACRHLEICVCRFTEDIRFSIFVENAS